MSFKMIEFLKMAAGSLSFLTVTVFLFWTILG